jgi:hypothetical protein
MSQILHMFTKRLITLQVIAGVLIGAAFMYGDHSQPTITAIPTIVRVGDAIQIQFDRPLAQDQSGAQISLATASGDQVPVTLRWQNRSASISPVQPLMHDTTYQLNLGQIIDRNGQAMRQPVSVRLQTTLPRFIYRTPEGTIARATAEGDSEVLTDTNKVVRDYVLSADGKSLVYSYVQEKTAGIVIGELVDQGLVNIRNLYQTEQESIGRIALCSADQVIVAATFPLQQNPGQEALALQAITAADGVTRRVEGLEAALRGVFTCLPQSDQLVYFDRQGQMQITSLSDTARTEPLGRFKSLYGPGSDGSILAGVTTAGVPAKRRIIRLTDAGVIEELTGSDIDAADPEDDPTGTWLASVEYRQLAPFSSNGVVTIARSEQGKRLVYELDSPGEQFTDERPKWSKDGRLLYFERIATEGSPDRKTDRDGRPLDGDIYVVSVDALVKNRNTGAPVVPKKLGTRGSMVTALP